MATIFGESVGDEVRDARDVIGVGMGHQDGEQRLADRFQLLAQGPALALGQGRVDRDDAGAALDQVGVHEDPALAARVRMDCDVRNQLVACHVFAPCCA